MIARALLLAVLTVAFAGPAEAGTDWAAVATPAPGQAEVIGSAAAGCLRGAVSLPLEGPGYQVLRPSRNRHWGHPTMVAFVRDLAATAAREGIPGLLIGDMAQPRGGPMASGHASHQNGLDVDIWFRLTPRRLGRAETEAPRPLGMVRYAALDQGAWTPDQARLLELAARAPEVERIFVNPVIKREMCRAAPAADRAWLAKLRPWWGHDEHFHVRLACPSDSPDCQIQKPFPEGDGCGAELLSWLDKPTWPAPPDKPHHQSRPLPDACASVLRR